MANNQNLITVERERLLKLADELLDANLQYTAAASTLAMAEYMEENLEPDEYDSFDQMQLILNGIGRNMKQAMERSHLVYEELDRILSGK
ncbi:hypothetical protein [Hydrogenimonas thermophila]|uniref:Uncharacterized protein n=1 Tax=Hydrogenimonas thermophila TaxID=223786 RepID=A0A1I5NPG9_9BACT|nr:hypothetical protein [Hydrogenimonas thermophila]SFP23703.1 hypothetical protein SAMN05216234_11160 [Hydrogenimonas thermophila]